MKFLNKNISLLLITLILISVSNIIVLSQDNTTIDLDKTNIENTNEIKQTQQLEISVSTESTSSTENKQTPSIIQDSSILVNKSEEQVSTINKNDSNEKIESEFDLVEVESKMDSPIKDSQENNSERKITSNNETNEDYKEQENSSNNTNEEPVKEASITFNGGSSEGNIGTSSSGEVKIIEQTTSSQSNSSTNIENQKENITQEELSKSDLNESNPKYSDTIQMLKTVEAISLALEQENTENKEDNPIEKRYLECHIEDDSDLMNYEGLMPEEINCDNQIQKKEIKHNETEKIVILNSSVEIDNPIRLYTDIIPTKINEFTKIEVYSKVEAKLLDNITYYDTNNDELFDRISWIVPHLSEQEYRIKISFNPIDFSENLTLVSTFPINNSLVANPINFNFNIGYFNLSRLKCKLIIDNLNSHQNLTDFNPALNLSLIWPTNLINGNHKWDLICKDNDKEKSISGYFIINDTFSLDIENKVYLPGENIRLRFDSKPTQTRLILKKPNGNEVILNNLNGPYPMEYNISGSEISSPGVYTVNLTSYYYEQPYSISKNFSVAKIDITPNKLELNSNENLTLDIRIDSPVEKISSIINYFGEGALDISYFSINENNINITSSHKYALPGTFYIKSNITIDGRVFSIQKGPIQVTNNIDSTDPEITLIGPENEAIIKSSTLTFSYKASDNIKLANCTFELYNNSGMFGVLIYSKTEINPENNKIYEIPMQEFHNGEFSWYIECYDNSSNHNENKRDFTIDLNNNLLTSNQLNEDDNEDEENEKNTSYSYSQKEEVDSLLSSLQDFMDKKETYSMDQKNVLLLLGLENDLGYFNKRLRQIDQDLGNNLKYVSDQVQKEKKIQEINNEISDIKNKLPLDVRIIKQQEFVKNSITNDLESVLNNYLSSKGNEIDKDIIKNLVETNLEFQKYLSVSTKVYQVEIEYKEKTKKITLISKKINIQNDSFEEIMEIIPGELISDINNTVFLSLPIEKQGNSVLISKKDLNENNELVYYIEKEIEPKEFEKTDTILFKEIYIKEVKITGFFLLSDLKFDNWLTYLMLIILGLFIIYLIFISIKRYRIYMWKKEEDGSRIFKYVKEAKKAIKREDIETAREKYHKIKEIYPLVPKGCRKHLYKDIKNIRIYIDKKDINALIKEYELAKKDKRTDDATRFYENIKKTYVKLPKKERLKVKNKLFKD
ncbi:MAG: hypothetical protein WC867_07055 [Candidatus Pacearchaeota archaeon]|jgi:hypothetical protein